MKRLLLIVVVAALALTLVPLAVAGGHGGGGWKHGHFKFNLVGTVTAVTPADAADPAAPVAATLTIKIRGGSHIKGMRAEPYTFTLTTEPKVRQLGGDSALVKTLADLAEGDWVKVRGTIDPRSLPKAYTITSIKYRDLSPDVEATPEPSPPAEL